MIQLVRPCRGHVTQWYGNRQSQDGRKHTGQDYAYYSSGQVMDEVFAAADGVVLYAGDSRNLGWPNGWYLNPDFDRNDAVDSSAGNVITIGHNQGGIRFDTTYNHLEAWTVKAGDTVRAGQRIGTIGATGYSFGKHLHFELLFRPFNFGTDTYGRADPNPYFVTGIAAAGSTPIPSTPSEEYDDVALTDKQANALDFVADNLPRMKEILDALDERTGNSNTGTLKKAADLVLRKINPTDWPDGNPMYIAAQADIDGVKTSRPSKYFRGWGEDKTIYENVNGKLRTLSYDEWKVEHAKGETFQDLDPAMIDILKEK